MHMRHSPHPQGCAANCLFGHLRLALRHHQGGEMQLGNTRSQPSEPVLAAATVKLATDPAAALAVAEDLLDSAPDLLPAQLLQRAA